MKTNFKVLPLMVCSLLGLQACQSGDSGPTIKAPNQLVDVGAELYARIRTSSEDADTLFASFGATDSDPTGYYTSADVEADAIALALSVNYKF